MQSKTLVAGASLLMLGGYLISQAVSSHIFERELDQAIENINARGAVQIERREIDKGWFTSSGVLLMTPALQGDWQAMLPYYTNHGVLSTSIKGELELSLKQKIQAEGIQEIQLTKLLGADPIVWQANYHTLSKEIDGELVLDAFSNQIDDIFLEGKGATFSLSGTPEDMALSGIISPWSFSDKASSLELSEISFATRYRQEQEGREKFTRGQLVLKGIQFQQPGGPEVEIDEVRYAGQGDLGVENLQLASRFFISEMRLDGQPALAGELDLSLSRIDAAAYRDFETAFRRELAQHHSQTLDNKVRLDDKELISILKGLEPQILGLLANSPRLTVKKISVISPLLNIQSQLSGELRFAAEDSHSLSFDDLDSPAKRQRWQRHLNGQLLWQGVPSLVALQLGLPLDDDILEIVIDAGRVSLDGQPLSLMP